MDSANKRFVEHCTSALEQLLHVGDDWTENGLRTAHANLNELIDETLDEIDDDDFCQGISQRIQAVYESLRHRF
jgi:hypothetical protein